MTTASLSYKDQYAWGLRVNPTFDQLLQSTKKPLRIPQPDRSAKWFALSNYRSFMLDAAKKYNDYEHLKLDYDSSGANLPQAAAMVHPAPEDSAWDGVGHFTRRVEEQDAYELAFAAMEAEHRREAAETRAQHLEAAHAPSMGHWFIDSNHQDLEEAGVEHDAPLPRPQLQSGRLPAPVEMPAAAGQIGLLRPFPTFEFLNSGQPRSFRESRLGNILEGGSSSSYDRMRNNALGR
jgi:hypothetical protein